MSTDMASAEAGSVPDALDLMDEIHKRLSQAKGICRVIHGNPDAKATGDRSICDSLWAVDELIEEAQRAFNELKEVTAAGSQAQP